MYANPHDALHDLHIYVQYMAGREVKRMTRNNEIPKADVKRLAKLMTNAADLLEAVNEADGSSWLYFIDRLARTLGLVSYDIQGEYRGYSSSSPSFVDNYIIVSEKNYAKFLALAPAEQEKRILEVLIIGKSEDRYERHTHNEFYETGVMGCLDGFISWGAATGIMPSLDFAPVRRFLLDLLKNCPPGEWVSVASLVAYLKANHPYFLIPKKIEPDRWGAVLPRYYNFHDGPERWNSREHIPDDAPDGFERVEGRYVARFLEHIPLTLRLVELAYDPRPYSRKMYPMLDYLQGLPGHGALPAPAERYRPAAQSHRAAQFRNCGRIGVLPGSTFRAARTTGRTASGPRRRRARFGENPDPETGARRRGIGG